MINANELRIGNLINNYYKGAESVSVGLLNMLEQFNPNEHQQIYFGIPLTEKWLTDFERKVTKYNDGTPDLISYKISDKIFLLKWISSNDITKDTWIVQIGQVALDCTELDFVHTFQNLVHALTGEELELKS